MYGDYPATRILVELDRDSLLPAILFRTARKQCDADIERISTSRIGAITEKKQQALIAEIKSIIALYSMEEDVILGHAHYGALITTGVGAHHAGQILMWRLMLEELMSRGLLRLMIATGTVAAGVDFPARTVVITAHSKRGSEGFKVLASSEFQQMSGRAGRRGKDSVGICLIAPGPFCDARVINQVSKQPPEPLRSAYFAAPSTVLNLLKFRNVDDLRYTVSKSLAAFHDRKSALGIRVEATELETQIEGKKFKSGEQLKKAEKRARRIRREADELEARQSAQLDGSLQALSTLGYIEGGKLTEKGYWAADLCTSLVLEIAEAIDSGLFYDLSVVELVGMVASIAGDSHRPYFSIKANPLKREYFEKMAEIIGKIQLTYPRAFISDVAVLPDAALTVISWMEAESWPQFGSLLRLAGVAEGDVARLVTQTADHLNQISRLSESHPALAETAAEGRKRILKPPLTEAFVIE